MAIATAPSPVMFRQVRNMSSTRSMPATSARPSSGSPTDHHLARRQIDVEYIRDEERADAHVERGSVHVDRRAQRQHEARDLTGRAKLFLQVFHVDRQRRGAGAGRKGQQHRLRHGGEKLHRGNVTAEPRDGRVDGNRVNRAADGQTGDDRDQRQEHFRAVGRDDGKQQGENADRREIHDQRDDLVAGLGCRVKKFDHELRALAADLDNADADEQGEHDDRQDLRFCHRFHRTGRNHRDQHLHDARRFLDVDLALGEHLQPRARLADAGDHEADQDRDGRRDQIDGDRTNADTSQRRRVAEARHADDQRRENHGNDHHLDQVDEDRADRSYPQLDERQSLRSHDQADNDGQYETDENFDG